MMFKIGKFGNHQCLTDTKLILPDIHAAETIMSPDMVLPSKQSKMKVPLEKNCNEMHQTERKSLKIHGAP